MKKMLLFLGILCLILFLFFYYKTYKNGNNITSKTQEEFIDYILNDIKEYKADIDVTVISNKTENIYKIKQEETLEKSVQEIVSPENIKGMKIELQGKNLKIINTNLNLEKVYDDYEAIVNNSLFLSVFVNEYKSNTSKNYELEDKIVLEVTLDNTNNTYAKYKELYINKETMKIEKLIIKDNAKKVRVSIKYNDIEIKYINNSILYVILIGVNNMVIKRGDMFYADLSPVVGSEQGGIRPVLIIQNDTGNKYSPTVIAAAITSQTGKNKLPTHIEIGSKENGLKADSVVLTEQIRTIDKSRLKEKIGHIDDSEVMSQVNNAIGISFGLED